MLRLVYEKCMWFLNYFIQRPEQGIRGFICADQVNEPMTDIPKTLEQLLLTWQNILFTAFTRVKEPVFLDLCLKSSTCLVMSGFSSVL